METIGVTTISIHLATQAGGSELAVGNLELLLGIEDLVVQIRTHDVAASVRSLKEGSFLVELLAKLLHGLASDTGIGPTGTAKVITVPDLARYLIRRATTAHIFNGNCGTLDVQFSHNVNS
jgi:hypothetical protein